MLTLNGQPLETRLNPIPRYGPWGLIRGQSPTGYGPRVPTDWMVRLNGRWRRVYCCVFSNVGTLFIGKSVQAGCIIESCG